MTSKLRELLRKDTKMILWLFDHRCIRCGRKTNTVHEIIPISHGRSSASWKNRVPVCNTCHDWSHAVGTNNSIIILQAKRREFLIRKFLLENE